jgi:hypothetical protein
LPHPLYELIIRFYEHARSYIRDARSGEGRKMLRRRWDCNPLSREATRCLTARSDQLVEISGRRPTRLIHPSILSPRHLPPVTLSRYAALFRAFVSPLYILFFFFFFLYAAQELACTLKNATMKFSSANFHLSDLHNFLKFSPSRSFKF